MDDDLLVDLLNSYDSDEVSRFTDDGRTSSRFLLGLSSVDSFSHQEQGRADSSISPRRASDAQGSNRAKLSGAGREQLPESCRSSSDDGRCERRRTRPEKASLPGQRPEKPSLPSQMKAYRERVRKQAESISSLQHELASAHEDIARRDRTIKTLKRRLQDAKAPPSPSATTLESREGQNLSPASTPAVTNGNNRELVADLRSKEKRAREVISQLRSRVSQDQEKIASLLLQLASVQKSAGRLQVEVDEGHESRRSMEQQLKSTLEEHLHLVSEAAAASSRAHAAEEQLLETKRHAATTATKLSALKYLCLQLEREGAGLRAQLGPSVDDEASRMQALPSTNGHRTIVATDIHGNAKRGETRATSAKHKPIADFKGLEDMYKRVYGSGKKVTHREASDNSDSNSSD